MRMPRHSVLEHRQAALADDEMSYGMSCSSHTCERSDVGRACVPGADKSDMIGCMRSWADQSIMTDVAIALAALSHDAPKLQLLLRRVSHGAVDAGKFETPKAKSQHRLDPQSQPRAITGVIIANGYCQSVNVCTHDDRDLDCVMWHLVSILQVQPLCICDQQVLLPTCKSLCSPRAA